MDRITAFTRLVARAVGSGDPSFMEEVEALIVQPPPIPPTPAGNLSGTAYSVAHHVEKNGFVTPAWGTEQMQHLTFKLTKVLEAFEEVLAESQRKTTATERHTNGEGIN